MDRGSDNMETRLLVPELHGYLLSLALVLEQAGNDDLGKRALSVSGFASGPASELYGQAEAFLADLLKRGAPGLSASDVTRLCYVLDGVGGELRRIGGA
jgi:hypothetical protein